MTWLIVDDLDEMRTVLSLTLQRLGWKIIEANDGVKALQAAEQAHPDVILMDYNMPNMNGIDACLEFKKHPTLNHIPVLIYTGAVATDVQIAAENAGATRFLVKPLLPADLRAVIEEVYMGDTH